MTQWFAPFFGIFATSLITALLTTPVARRIAWKIGSVDYPGGRRVNSKPLPRMGGIAVFVALIAGLLFQLIASHFFGWPRIVPSSVTTARLNYPLIVF